jgi:hypothetical protein
MSARRKGKRPKPRTNAPSFALSTKPIPPRRELIGAQAIRDEPTILIPVRDNRFAPALWCGEFAVVNTRITYAEDGAFVYVRDERCNYLNIVLLRTVSEKELTYLKPCENHPTPFWNILLGRQRVGNWNPAVHHDWAPDGWVSMSDGAQSEKYLLPSIVGRVIGVLGDKDRSLKWKSNP